MAKKQVIKKGENESEDYSEWMSRLPQHKLTEALFDLVLPGSHDSMSYDLDLHSSIIEPELLKKYSHLRCVRKIVRRWGRTQEASITEQLEAGVRYFDLRIARKENDHDPTRLFFYHGLFTHSDVETVLRSINRWAELHPKEILVLALSHFKNFGSDAEKLHKHLTTFITTTFNSKLLHRPVHKDDVPTVQRCWEQKQNVIVSYDHSEATRQPQFWFKIIYFYADDMDPAKVEESLAGKLKNAFHGYFFVCGLNLTLPEDASALKYVLTHRSLASLERRSLPQLLKWIQHQADLTQLNIVASDFVTEDNVIPTIVSLNTHQTEANSS